MFIPVVATKVAWCCAQKHPWGAQLLSPALSPNFIKEQFFGWKGRGGGWTPGAHGTGVRAVPCEGISVVPVAQLSLGSGGK